jgi:Protein of unknown function (DUF2911)
MNARTHAGVRVTAALCLAGVATACGPKPVTRSFVATIGTQDTVAVESYQRVGDTLSGMSVRAYPQTALRTYKIAFGPGGDVQSVHVSTGMPGSVPSVTADYTYTGDSVIVQAKRDTLTRRVSVATQGERPLPFYEDLFAFWDLGLGQAMSGTADSTTFGALSGSSILPVTFRKDGATGAAFSVPQWGTAHATLDQADQVDHLDMSHTTTKYDVVLVDSVDVAARAGAWAARPKPGPLSPRDTARANVGRAHVVVDYGRPAVRGRQVWGGLIPFNQVWRTGANAATQLIVDRPLVIGGKAVPAGTYSIWSEATQSDWTLIVNKQHGQWGTVYDSAQDLIRVPITRSSLPEPMERFTIAVTGTGANRGTLTLTWGDVQGTVPFVVR